MCTKTQIFTVAALIIAAIILISFPIVFMTIAYHHRHHHHPEDPPSNFQYPATQFLRSNNYTFIANLIHISPDLFISTPEATIFAIPDSVMSNLSIAPYMTIELVTYHISPNKLTIQELFKKPLNTCLSTMFQQQKISITKKDEKQQLLEINNVLITNPDLFLDSSVAIHGVSGPFAAFNLLPEINELPICSMNQTQPSNTTSNTTVDAYKLDFVKIKAEWKMVVKFLSASGFTPFAYWLYNVLDGIIEDHPSLNSMTIFAPPIIEIMEVPPSEVHRFLRYHIVPKKHSFKHLASMPEGTSIMTLCPGREIEITRTVVSLSDELLSINRVEITSPDLLSTRSFVVHGIARAFAMDAADKS